MKATTYISSTLKNTPLYIAIRLAINDISPLVSQLISCPPDFYFMVYGSVVLIWQTCFTYLHPKLMLKEEMHQHENPNYPGVTFDSHLRLLTEVETN